MSNTLKEHAQKQGERVSYVLEMLFNALVKLDSTDGQHAPTSFFIDYDEQDMFHAATIFYSVCGNYAIKHGYLTQENAERKVSQFRDMIKDIFGLDTIQEAQVQIMLNKIKNGN